MATNFKPWVDTPTAGQQVQSASVFASDAQRVDGFKAGDPASALRVNSALRQANIVIAGLMQFCDDVNTLPNDLSLLSTVTQVKNAIKASIDTLHDTTLTSAKTYTDTRETSINTKITNVQTQVTMNKNDITTLIERVDDYYAEIPEIDKTSNVLIGDGAGNAVDSGISALTILNTLTAVTTTGNPVNIQNTNDGFIDRVKIVNNSGASISSPLTGKSVGKNRFNDTAVTFQNPGNYVNGEYTVSENGVYTNSWIDIPSIQAGTYTFSINIKNNSVDKVSGEVSVRKYNSSSPIYIKKGFISTSTYHFITFTMPVGESGVRIYLYGNPTGTPYNTSLTFSNFQLELGSTATDFSAYTETEFSIPLKNTSGTVLDLNPADVIEIIDGKYHLNSTELHDDSQDALRAIPTYQGQTNLIGDQPFTFDVTEFQLGLESIDAMLTLPDGIRVNVLTKDRMVYITSGEYAGKTLEYVLQEFKNYINGGILYDKVIRTQTEFKTLIESPTWFDATSVAFVGQFTLDTTDNSGIKIPSTVKQIHGFNSAKITITNFLYNETTAKGGLWYDTAPTTQDYSIRDLEVSCAGKQGRGFYYCNNLSNCTGTGIGAGIGGHGFHYCNNLSNCTGTGIGAGGAYGFVSIDYAVNCKDGGSSTNMWYGTNKNISVETCRKTLVSVDNTTLNT